MSIYKKLASAFGLSVVNFALSALGVFLSMKLIPFEEWGTLGFALALLPITTVLTFFMKHQYPLVSVAGESTKHLNAVLQDIVRILPISLPIVLFIYTVALDGDIGLVIVSVILSVALGFRLVQKYALTLDSKPVELYKSNIISLVIWILSLFLFSFVDAIDSFYRLFFNTIGEVVAFIYINNISKGNISKNKPLKLGTDRVININLFRVLIRQLNYNLPVYLINALSHGTLSSQIGLLSRARVVIDQVINVFVVSMSKRIMDAPIKVLLLIGLLMVLPILCVIYVATILISMINGALFSEDLVRWVTILVSIWAGGTLVTLNLERKNRIGSLLVFELAYMSFCIITFFLIFSDFINSDLSFKVFHG